MASSWNFCEVEHILANVNRHFAKLKQAEWILPAAWIFLNYD